MYCNKLKVLDLFSGIGGFSLGLESTGGFRAMAFCEIDEYCNQVLEKHWPNVTRFKDIKNLKPDSNNYDVVCGGFPCQDISTAGRQKGLNGERSGLWKEFFRVIKEVKPKYTIIENVANLRSKGLNQVLKDLWSIGYDCQWHILPASSIGAFHQRERLWIIAYPECERLQRPWKCFDAINKEKDRYREAGGIINAFQAKQLPFVCRGHDGLSKAMDRDRLKALGNAIEPGIAEIIGNKILEWESTR